MTYIVVICLLYCCYMSLTSMFASTVGLGMLVDDKLITNLYMLKRGTGSLTKNKQDN